MRGIPRSLLDPSRRYLIAYVGRRWEVVAIEADGGSLVPWGPEDVATQAERGRVLGDRAQGPERPV